MHKQKACKQYFRILRRSSDQAEILQSLGTFSKARILFVLLNFYATTTFERHQLKMGSSVTVLYSSLSYFLLCSFQIDKRKTLMNAFDIRRAKESLSLQFFAGSSSKVWDPLCSRIGKRQIDGKSFKLFIRRTERPLQAC